MKKLNDYLRGGEEKYLSPCVSRVEISVEKGFAQSGLTLEDPDFSWGDDIDFVSVDGFEEIMF